MASEVLNATVDSLGLSRSAGPLTLLNVTFVNRLLSCDQWLASQHLLFQAANICFCVSYLAPNGTYGILFMHTVLILGFLLFSTWAWNVICAPDVFSWNFSFVIINMFQMLYILYQMRPVRFAEELEDIFQNVFEPLQISRQIFKKLVSQEYAQILSLHTGEAYAMQNLTKTDRLGLLISGKVNVMTDNHFLHHIYAKQFLDSPEFESSRAGVEDKFKVTIIAATPCRYVFWLRESLEYLFVKDTYLAHVMSILIARDVTTKLYAMNEKNNPGTAPLVLWLQGGPGDTSLYSLFIETGPWRITPDLQITETNYTWASAFNMLYIDNPVGTGKYIPAIAYKIHEENQNAVMQINLKGVAIGNGLIDPVTQIHYGDYLFNAGLIDNQQRNIYYEHENLTIEYIKAGDLMQALQHFDILVVGSFVTNFSYFRNFTGLTDIYNIRVSRPPVSERYLPLFVQLPSTMKAVHVGNHTMKVYNIVSQYLLPDIMNTTKPWLESLLDNGYKVLIYSGLIDACIPYTFTENMIRHLDWSHADEYKDADRLIWKVDQSDVEVAGYAKKVHNFQEVTIRNSGHMVPADQPRAALDMIARFVFDTPF